MEFKLNRRPEIMISKKFNADVLIAGGGVAGVAAAVTAARNGLKTLLVESQGSLGGLATNGLVTGVAGMVEGICKEFLDRMNAERALIPRPHLPSFDPEKGKIVLERMLLEAGAKILYWTYVIDASVEDNHIKEIVCHSKSGRIGIAARIVIDTTGDADVAARAGVPYEAGSPDFEGLNMATTLAFRMANVNLLKYREAMQAWRTKQKIPVGISIIAELEEKAVRNGDLPYFIFPTALIYQVPQTPEDNADVTIMTAHSFNTRNMDIEDLTRQTIEQHEQIMLLEKFFRKYVPGFKNCRLSGIANLHGIRDSRRITGEYILTDEDVVCARKFEDGIAKFPEFFDTHHPTSPRIGFMRHVHLKEPKEPAVCRPAECSIDMHPFVRPGGYEARCNPKEYCEIPYRSLVPLKIDNLLTAGRCVSAEFNALAAVRVIATGMSTGQASGIAAALCIKNGLIPRKLDGRIVRKTMIEQGVPLDKEPDGHWAAVKKLEGEYVVGPGDFAWIKTPDGYKAHF
jgi:hypothetical protein